MFSYALKNHWFQILFALLVFAGLIGAALFKPEWYDIINWFEAIVGVGTLIIAAFLWWNSAYREWNERLPKRITVQYQWQGRNVMICHDALLVSESDARTWALQIGQQMSRCQRLKFEPFFNLKEVGIRTEKTTGQQFRSYIFTYYLTELPVPDNESPDVQNEFKNRLEKGCVERYPHYSIDGAITMTDGYVLSNSQTFKPN